MIDTFIWSNGTNESPITLTEAEMEILIKAGKNSLIDTSVSGVYTTQTKTIRNYLYQVLHELYPNLIKHNEVSITNDDVQFTLHGITAMKEGSSVLIESTGNVPIEYLTFTYNFASVSEGFTNELLLTIKNRITTEIIDNGVGNKVLKLSIAPPEENISWSASLRIVAYPSYLPSNSIPLQGAQNRHDEIIVILGIRLNGITIAGPATILPGGTYTYLVRPTNGNTTKLSNSTIYTFAVSPNNTGLTPIPNDSATGDYGVIRKTGNNWIFTANTLPSGEASADIVLSVNVYLKRGEASIANATLQVTSAEEENLGGGGSGGSGEGGLSGESAAPYLTGSFLLHETGTSGTPNTIDNSDTANVINWIRSNSHIYVGGKLGTQSKMYLKQVSDNDKRYWADNTMTNINYTLQLLDVFMKLPEFWYKLESYNVQDTYQVSFSTLNPSEHNDNTTWLHWDGKTLIGVYEGSVVGGRLRSIPGKYPCASGTFDPDSLNLSQIVNGLNISLESYSYTQLKGLAENGGAGFHLTSFEAHTVMALLGYATYSNVDIQTECGRGTPTRYLYNNSAWYLPRITGICDEYGMTDTRASDVDIMVSDSRVASANSVNTSDDKSTNFWGLENWWGNIAEYIDNLLTIDGVGRIGIYDLGVTFNNDGTATLNSTYVSPTLTVVSGILSGSSRCGTKMQFVDTDGNFAGIAPRLVVSDANMATGYCDKFIVYNAISRVAFRSGYSNNLDGGLSTILVDTGLEYPQVTLGSRILYRLDTVDSELLIVNLFPTD